MIYGDDLLRAAAGAQRRKQAELALETGLTRQTVSRILDGDPRASYENILKVSKALGFDDIPRAGESSRASDVEELASSLPQVKTA